MLSRVFFGFLTIAYALFICAVTLTPASAVPQISVVARSVLEWTSMHDATAWITFDYLEFAANIGMFVPLGFFLALTLPRRARWLGVVLLILFTFFIEGYQGEFLPLRVADPRDLVSNSAGALIGAVVAWVVSGYVHAIRGAITASGRERSRARGAVPSA